MQFYIDERERIMKNYPKLCIHHIGI